MVESRSLNGKNIHTHIHKLVFTAGTFIPHTSSSLKIESGACGHPKALFVRPGVCTTELLRGG